ncbi:MAG: nucleoside-diphosphate sugar epimerase [Rhodospirillales bacterium RIFCSPLOWO2_12_FULL_58_28]|nr:MAG: nucleoside-diphosphate sugar epimerase [Rhodospirillales bacterium RIFCSPLOWO2_02_FULL_58_16]OHC79345.1 MAG: nucleoside-diphosphate sugar epimerase [Rhodospirillales bacterium RIFCSPLOWO2_12_FULL_58_28]
MTDFIIPSDVAEIAGSLGDSAEAFTGKTVLLTGGRGFLGRYFMEVFAHLNDNVLKKPCRLIVLDNLITAGKEGSIIPDMQNVKFINHDVAKPLEIKDKIDYVIHAAGIASPFYYRAFPLETLETAVAGAKNMLELAVHNQARFTFFSSSEIYGDPDPKHVPTSESYRGNVSCQGPRACYDESKRLGETLCHIFHEMHGVCTNTIRPFNVFGPGMQETDYRAMPNFASRIKADKPLSIYGSGDQTRTFCYITDAMNGFLRVIVHGVPGEAYNIGNPKPEVSMIDLAGRVEKVIGRKIKYNIIEYPDSYPADEPQRRCPDIRKATLQVRYEPKIALDEGLRRFFAWTDATYSGEA